MCCGSSFPSFSGLLVPCSVPHSVQWHRPRGFVRVPSHACLPPQCCDVAIDFVAPGAVHARPLPKVLLNVSLPAAPVVALWVQLALHKASTCCVALGSGVCRKACARCAAVSLRRGCLAGVAAVLPVRCLPQAQYLSLSLCGVFFITCQPDTSSSRSLCSCAALCRRCWWSSMLRRGRAGPGLRPLSQCWWRFKCLRPAVPALAHVCNVPCERSCLCRLFVSPTRLGFPPPPPPPVWHPRALRFAGSIVRV
jgi:hypothetical protein